ncbi:hypothetical protein [Paludisphaera mucosa]|uniref:Secretin/TonB short N-terminal domain-containing protein n=1 Tax=Paludisphaera mucosa TaxID=3030827 RepID=A0ABT6FL71_9BACT|nr:hypothetical protein [Paludisphaera mucosa]MDG3008264.1 hypothetical protein [Paludisphaera mucosa]
MTRTITRFLGASVALSLALVAGRAGAEEPAAKPRDDARAQIAVEVDDVSIWVGNPSQTTLNAAKAYRNPMPGVVGTSRPKLDDKELAGLFPIAPGSFVQFFGEPSRDVDVDLKIKKGTFLAHWPGGKEYAGRVRWFGSDLLAEPPPDLPASYLPDDGGLLSKLRANPAALYLKNETRFERFIAYDADVALPIPVRIRGGPDEYTLQNMTNRRLVDVAVIAPSESGFRIGWLDELPSAAADKDAQEKAEAEKKEAEKKAAEARKADPAKQAEEVFGDAAKGDEKKEKPDEPTPLPAEGDAEVRARVDQFLNRPITAAVESAPRRDLLGMVSAQCRLRFEFDDKTLTKEKVDLAKPTGLKAAGVPARDALADLLGGVGLSYRVTEEGRLFITTAGRLAEAADKKGGPVEGPPIKLGMSQPLKSSDPSYREFTHDALARRLEGRGLRKDVIALVLDRLSKDLFEPGELLILAHLSREAIDEAVPLDVFPTPKKFTRVALVVVHGVDPRLQDRAKAFVQQLGDPSWKSREAAEARLLALGPAAVPALEEALRDKDVEVVYRVERLLLKLNRNVP